MKNRAVLLQNMWQIARIVMIQIHHLMKMIWMQMVIPPVMGILMRILQSVAKPSMLIVMGMAMVILLPLFPHVHFGGTSPTESDETKKECEKA